MENDLMFYQIGKKIQIVAKVITYAGVALSIIAGLILFGFACNDPDKLKGLFFLAPVAVVVGSLAAWLSAIRLYGFGKLIEDTEAIRNKIDPVDDEAGHDVPPTKTTVSEPASYAYPSHVADYDTPFAKETVNTPVPCAPLKPTSALQEAMFFVNRNYHIKIDFSDDIKTLKEKIMGIEYVDEFSERFKHRVANAITVDEVWTIINRHYVLLKR